jgi:hypothetical protein
LDHQSCAPGGFEQVERIGAWEKVIGWAQAQQIREIASLTARAVATAEADAADRAAARAAGEPVGPEVAYCHGQERAGAEVALMLRGHGGQRRSAGRRGGHAHRAVSRGAGRAGSRGVTLTKVRIVAEQTAQLSDAQAAAVTERVLGRAGAQTPTQLRQSLRRAVARTDQDALRRRQQAAVRERGVSLYDLPDGMATLSARLPAAEAVGVYAVLDHHARCSGGADSPLGHPAAGRLRHHDAARHRPLLPAPPPLKQTPRWTVTREPDGSVIWTTPTGHSYRSTPPTVAEPTPAPPRAPDPDEPPPF